MEENIIKKYFSKGTNPDNQKFFYLKVSGLVVIALIAIALCMRFISAIKERKADDQADKTFLQYDQKSKQGFMAEFESMSGEDVRLSDNSSAGFDKNGQGFSSRFQNENSGKPRPGHHRKAQSLDSSESRVNAILSKASQEPESLPQEDKFIDPYPYKYQIGEKIEASYMSPYWRRILSPDYELIRKYNNSALLVYNDAKTQKTDNTKRDIKKAESRKDPLLHRDTYKLSAGSIIKAVTLDRINSDFPTTVRGRVTSPFSIAGSIILMKTNAQANNRINVLPDKIVLNEVSIKLSGVIKSGLPGLTGSVNRHMVRKTLNPLAAAGLMAYGTVFGSRSQNNINTEDAIRAQIIQEGLNLGVNELQKYSGDVPNTVDVKIGTPFEILLTEDLNLE